MKKIIKIALKMSLFPFIIMACQSNERLDIENESLVEEMKTVYIGKLDDKLSKEQSLKMYDILFMNPENFGFTKIDNDMRFNQFYANNIDVYIRKLSNQKEENIIKKGLVNYSSKNANSSIKFYIRSHSCVCTGYATIEDPTGNFVNDDCSYETEGIYNFYELTSVNGYNNYGSGKGPGWIYSEFSEVNGTTLSDNDITNIVNSVPDAWLDWN